MIIFISKTYTLSQASANKRGIDIPKPIRLFLLKSVIVFTAWQLLYSLVLAPIRIPDNFLTNITAASTAKIMSIFYGHIDAALNAFKVILRLNGKKVIGIADPCNALEIYVLYLGFLICYPASARLRVIFIAIGLPAIFVANVVRCCLLVWLNIAHRGWVDIAHHYIFTALVYLIVFYLWMIYSKKAHFVK